MQIYSGYKKAQGKIPRCVFAIGNFDGVHLGHVKLLDSARRLASELRVGFGVYTFSPHPLLVLNPSQEPKLISSLEQKREQFRNHGVEHLVEEPFTNSFSELSAHDFTMMVLAQSLDARGIVTGANFRFGHKAMGTPDHLSSWLSQRGIPCIVEPTVHVEGTVCSSSRIRELIELGKVEQAALFLGRYYSLEGVVVHGSQRGQSIGIPTANMTATSSLVPMKGVYATHVRVPGFNKLYKGATNIGVRPTFHGDNKIQIETHILNFTGQIYDQPIELFFVQRIRDERQFEGVAELLAQIHKDLAIALEC